MLVKHLCWLVFLLPLTNCIRGQNTSGAYSYTLDVNNITITLDPDGSIAYGLYNPPLCNAPSSGHLSPLYGAWFWLTGVTSDHELRSCTPDWSNAATSLHRGPYNADADQLPATASELMYIPYTRVWKVSASDIETHIARYSDPSYTMPEAILYWPGNGDTALGFPEQIAPFGDVNSNAVYEPHLGDHPLIKGDAAIYGIYHDRSTLTTPEFAAMDLEVHVMLYAFNSPDIEAMHNTIFADFTVFNRGSFTYDTLMAGLFADYALGAYDDDFCGSDSTMNLIYTYNADPTDGPSPAAYSSLPAFGVQTLSHNMFAHRALFNNNDPLGYPSTTLEFHRALLGLFTDGMPMTAEHSGYNPGASNFTKYLFHDHPADTTGWNEVMAGNEGSDRRAVASIQESNFRPGDRKCFTYALTFADADIPFHTTASVDLLRTYANTIPLIWRDAQLDSCLQSTQYQIPTTSTEKSFGIYPNPSNGIFTLQTEAEVGTILQVSLWNSLGQHIHSTELTNASDNEQHTLNYQNTLPGIYYLLCHIYDHTVVIPIAIQ